MKTNRPTITVKPDQSKARQDGMAPVYIYVNWRGRAKQTTGIYTKPSEWRERTLSIVSSPSSTRKLREMVEKAEMNIDKLMEQGQPFTAKDVLQTAYNTRITPTQLALMMARDRGLAANTQAKYTASCRLFERLTDKHIFDLSTDEWRGLAVMMKDDGYTLTTIWTALSVYKAMLEYAVDHGYTKANNLAKWHFKQEGFRAKDNPRALRNEEVEQLWEWYQDTDSLAGLLWFASYYFNGLALCDLLAVDWSAVELKHTSASYYYDGGLIYRSKTKAKVPVICTISRLGFLPDLANKEDRRKHLVVERMKTVKLNRPVSYYSSYVNGELKKSGIKGITFYTARHTYCTSLVNARVPLNDIATLMGRNMNTLATYIRQVTSADHLVSALASAK